MTLPILATKLYIPPPRTKVVHRRRLIERLNAGINGKLTLISAPAGFGKTTLISEWLMDCNCRTAWLSLDEGDSDPIRFLTYLVAAVQTIAPNMDEGLISVVQSPQPPSTEIILTALVNEIATMPDPIMLVLDDYHLIDAPPVDHALNFLLEHLPRQMHLVITTREDPNLPLARLRARSQLTELRAADLRFTPEEAVSFLSQVMGLNLSAQAIAALEERTEGWIAGLQLAALSLQEHPDVSDFIQAFAGDHRYIVDYLVEEVLERQPEAVRNFLLQTAILDRLNGSLCDAVTGQNDGSSRLEGLDRGNFFIIPLDNQRHWYRYHHLFADVLRMHLMTEQTSLVPTLHQRASEWYWQNGWMTDAIRHAFAAGDFESAAGMIEAAAPHMRRTRQEALLLSWHMALPDEIFLNRPVLSIDYVGALLSTGQFEGVETRLQTIEQWVDPTTDFSGRYEMIVINQEEFLRLPASIAMYRAALALAVGDVPNTITYARRLLDLVSEDDHVLHGAAAALLGLSFWTTGDLEAAHRTYAEGMASLKKAGNISDAINGAYTLAAIRIAQGHPREAMHTYERALQLANEQGEPQLRGTGDLYVGMGELYYERDDLNTATQYLLKSREMGEHSRFPQNRYRWYIVMARIRQSEGDLDSALHLLDEAERLYMSDFSPNVRPVAALKIRLWIAQGRLSEALAWAGEQGLSVDDELSYLREFEHITLARILLAQHQRDGESHSMNDVMNFLERLLKSAEEGGRMRSVIEILILQALSHQMQGDNETALTRLERALILAEPEGYIRLFVDEGPPMATLLEKAMKQTIKPNYVRQLLSAFGKAENKSSDNQQLVEPLSDRELEVLRLFGTELSGPEIADELMISLNTLRTHTKNIYTKLEVNNRRTAIRRAEELGLL